MSEPYIPTTEMVRYCYFMQQAPKANAEFDRWLDQVAREARAVTGRFSRRD